MLTGIYRERLRSDRWSDRRKDEWIVNNNVQRGQKKQ